MVQLLHQPAGDLGVCLLLLSLLLSCFACILLPWMHRWLELVLLLPGCWAAVAVAAAPCCACIRVPPVTGVAD